MFDREAGLHYNYFRDYDPASGRYVQSDPIGLAGGVNTYGYADSVPTMYTDAAGLQAQAVGCALGLPFGGPVGCGVGIGITTVGTVVGVGVMMSVGGDASPSDRAAQSSERKAYKRRCTEPPPPALSGCDLLRWLLQRNMDCKRMREDYAKKYFGDDEPNHAAEITNYASAIRRLEEEIARKCCGH